MQQLNSLPSVQIVNQDQLFKIILFCINKKKILNIPVNNLRLSINPFTQDTLDLTGNKIKSSPQLLYLPIEGRYPFPYKSHQFYITLQRGQIKIVTNQRKIQAVKKIIIQCQGDSVDPIKTLISQVTEGYGQSASQQLIIYENSGGSWVRSKQKYSRSIQSVILDKQISTQITEDLLQFIESQQWYKKMGVPYRRGYLLHGPPGTGKSSFTQALAGYLKYSICFINVSDRINDYAFNYLLNRAPKKSIILIQDVDAMFDGRKNKEHSNMLTYSGFLNSIDGVRSQEGRIIIMTTNHKQKLDPALLRPGRIDVIFQLSYSSKTQIYRLFNRFFDNDQLAKKISQLIPQKTFSMSQLQGFFVKYKRNPKLILQRISQLLDSQQNVRVQQFLQNINCSEVVNDFKLQNCFNLSAIKNLPNDQIQKLISSRISKQKLIRLIQVLRNSNFKIQKSKEVMTKYVEDYVQNIKLKEQMFEAIKMNQFLSMFHLKDKIIIRNKQINAEIHKKKNKQKIKQINSQQIKQL